MLSLLIGESARPWLPRAVTLPPSPTPRMDPEPRTAYSRDINATLPGCCYILTTSAELTKAALLVNMPCQAGGRTQSKL